MHAMNAAPAAGRARLKDDLERSSHEVSHALADHLREHARSLGWPEHVAAQLEVVYADGGYHPRCPDDAEVHAWEYGGPDRRAAPAMRTWAGRSHEHASHAHDRALFPVIARELF